MQYLAVNFQVHAAKAPSGAVTRVYAYRRSLCVMGMTTVRMPRTKSLVLVVSN